MAEPSSATSLGERYMILGELSKGGMGVVYKAQDLAQNRVVAVKILRPGQKVPGAQRRFINEAQLLARIKHPNIVEAYDSGGLSDGRQYLAMEYLDGPTLGSLLKSQPGRFEPLRACRIALQIVRGLLAVHAQGVVHRDLKPENIFLINHNGQPDFVKIIDFGIAKDTAASADDRKSLRGPAEPGAGSGPPSNPSGSLSALADESYTSETAKTRPGSALGSPRYMAPEQVRGAEIDARTDQYALGCILYQMLAGSAPFHGATPLDMMMAHTTSPVTPLRQRCPGLSITDSLEQLVLRMLAKPREQRFPTLREVETALVHEISLLEQGEHRGAKSSRRDKQSRHSDPTRIMAPAKHRGSSAAVRPIWRRLPRWLYVTAIMLLLVPAGSLVWQWGAGADKPLAPLPSPADPAALAARQKEAALLNERSLRWVREALSDPSAAVREAGVAVLSDCVTHEAVPLLASMLDDSDLEVRIAAARALARRPLPNPQVLSALRTGLRDPDVRVRVESLHALGVAARRQKTRWGAGRALRQEAAQWFADTLRSGSLQEQAAARAVLVSLGDKDQLVPLRAFLKSSDAEVRRVVAEEAGYAPELAQELPALLADGAKAVRFAAARSLALVRPGEPRAASIIMSFEDRKAVLAAAPRLPLATALPLLRQAAADPEPLMRRLAAEAIGDLPGNLAAPSQSGEAPPIDLLRMLSDDRNALVQARASAVLARLLRGPPRSK